MDEVNKVLFIINKFAGKGYRPDLDEQILRRGEAHNTGVKIVFTEGPGHATTLAAQAQRHGYNKVVAVGGDGTLNEVAQGLANSAVQMGIIARGSGNGLARHLCIPLSIPAAVENIFQGSAFRMDTFFLNGKLSLNVSGIGFDGHIANLFGGKTKRGLSGYASLILQEYLRFKEFEFEITAGTNQYARRGFVVAIANSSQYGNNACIAPAASVTDGILHVTMLRKVPAYRLDFVYSFFNRTVHTSGFSEVIEAPSLTIRTASPVPFHVDGEPCGSNDTFDIHVNPASLQVIAPATTRQR